MTHNTIDKKGIKQSTGKLKDIKEVIRSRKSEEGRTDKSKMTTNA